MGGTESKTIQEVITDTTTNVLLSNKNICRQEVVIDQTMKLNAGGNITIGGGITQKTMSKIDQDCMQNADNQVALQNEIANKLSQALNAKNDSIGYFNTEQEMRIKNYVSNTFNSQNISEIANKVNIAQLIDFTAGGDINIANGAPLSQEAFSDAVQKAVSDVVNKSDITQLVGTDLAQDTKVSANPIGAALSGIAGVIGAIGGVLTGPLLYIILIIGAIVVARIITSFLSKKDAPPQPIQPEMYQQPMYAPQMQPVYVQPDQTYVQQPQPGQMYVQPDQAYVQQPQPEQMYVQPVQTYAQQTQPEQMYV
jgi:hypothetical protein